jgi:LuxR family maltose regulon positive regulatory protein
VAQGRLHAAKTLYEEAIAYGLAQNGGEPFPPAGYAYAGLGDLFYEQNELEHARHYALQARRLGEALGNGTVRRRSIMLLTQLAQSAGDWASAEALWQRGRSIRSPIDEGIMVVAQVRFWLIQIAMTPHAHPQLVAQSDKGGEPLAAAIRWSKRYGNHKAMATGYWEILTEITLAWVALAQGQPERTLARLEPLTMLVRDAGQSHNMVRICVLQALGYQAQDDSTTALSILSSALELAAPAGYIRTFVDFGWPMQRLLRMAAEQGTPSAYLTTLLAAFPATDQAPDVAAHPSVRAEFPVLVDSLNERETTILRLMAAGLSNQEIADELYLSLNTIKWYVRHLFDKLAVNKRTQAVARAQELHLL